MNRRARRRKEKAKSHEAARGRRVEAALSSADEVVGVEGALPEWVLERLEATERITPRGQLAIVAVKPEGATPKDVLIIARASAFLHHVEMAQDEPRQGWRKFLKGRS